jgi:hypothetical protein
MRCKRLCALFELAVEREHGAGKRLAAAEQFTTDPHQRRLLAAGELPS